MASQVIWTQRGPYSQVPRSRSLLEEVLQKRWAPGTELDRSHSTCFVKAMGHASTELWDFTARLREFSHIFNGCTDPMTQSKGKFAFKHVSSGFASSFPFITLWTELMSVCILGDAEVIILSLQKIF